MKPYIRHSLRMARPMTFGEFLALYKDTYLSAESHPPEAPGYAYLEGMNPNWLTAATFESDYHGANFSFEDALMLAKSGQAVRRTCWPRDKWIALSSDAERPRDVQADMLWSPHAKRIAEERGGTVAVASSIITYNDGVITMGYNPSQEDLMAYDWALAKEEKDSLLFHPLEHTPSTEEMQELKGPRSVLIYNVRTARPPAGSVYVGAVLTPQTRVPFAGEWYYSSSQHMVFRATCATPQCRFQIAKLQLAVWEDGRWQPFNG